MGLLLIERAWNLAKQQVDGAFDGRERRPQLMGNVGNKVRFQSIQLPQPLVGNGKFLSSFRDLVLQAAVSLAEILCHLIELVREDLDLVPGFDVEAVIEISTSDPFDALTKCLKRSNDSPRHKQACEQSHSQAYQQQARRAQHRGIKRLVNLLC